MQPRFYWGFESFRRVAESIGFWSDLLPYCLLTKIVLIPTWGLSYTVGAVEKHIFYAGFTVCIRSEGHFYRLRRGWCSLSWPIMRIRVVTGKHCLPPRGRHREIRKGVLRVSVPPW